MLTCAIWGSGQIAETHAEMLRANGIAIAAVVSRRAEAARDFAVRWDIPAYGTDPALLFQEDICAVHICTPPALHYEMALECLRRGKHVLCEKPLCLGDDEARTLTRLAEEKGLVCAVNFNVRFHDACQAARAIVQSPDFGRVLLIHGSYLQEFGSLPAPKDWRYDPRLAGNMHAVTEIGSHWVDIAQHISGKRITAVSAQFGAFWPVRQEAGGVMYPDPAPDRIPCPVDSEDAAVLSLRFEGGAIGAVTLSEVSPGRYNHLSLEITGEHGNIWWNAEQSSTLCFARRDGSVRSQLFPFSGAFSGTFRQLMAAFYRDIAAGGASPNPDYPTFRDGLRNAALCNAIYESASGNGRWVALPEEERNASWQPSTN